MELIVYVKQGKKGKKRIPKKDIIVSFFSRKELFYSLIQDSEDFKCPIFIKKRHFPVDYTNSKSLSSIVGAPTISKIVLHEIYKKMEPFLEKAQKDSNESFLQKNEVRMEVNGSMLIANEHTI